MSVSDTPPDTPRDTPQARGGRARAKKLTPERRKDIARAGGLAKAETANEPKRISARVDALLARRQAEDEALRAALQEVIEAKALLDERETKIRQALGEGVTPRPANGYVAPGYANTPPDQVVLGVTKAGHLIVGSEKVVEARDPNGKYACEDCGKTIKLETIEKDLDGDERCPNCGAAPLELERLG